MAKSPLAELREMNVSKQREARGNAGAAPAPEPPPDDLITQMSNQVSNASSKHLSNSSVAPTSDGLSVGVSNGPGEDASDGPGEDASDGPGEQAGGAGDAPGPAAVPRRPAPARRGPRAAAGGAVGYAGVRDRLQAGAGKEPLVRLSVDVTESLHSRLKQYCAVNRVPSGRMLIVTLLEDFLDSEGA